MTPRSARRPIARLVWARRLSPARRRLRRGPRDPERAPTKLVARPTFTPDSLILATGGHGPKSLWSVDVGVRWTVPTEGDGLFSRGPDFSADGKRLFPNGVPWKHPQINQHQGSYAFDIGSTPPARIDPGSGEIVLSPDGVRYAAVQGEARSGRPRVVVMRDLATLPRPMGIRGPCSTALGATSPAPAIRSPATGR